MTKPAKGPARDTAKSDINVTPLVDVCLVLLIIFMVVTPMLDHRADIELPKTTGPASLKKDPPPLTLAMKEDRSMWYEESWLPSRQLTAKLQELHREDAGRELVLVADGRLSFGDVRRMMRIVNDAGFTAMNLAATKEGRAAASPAAH